MKLQVSIETPSQLPKLNPLDPRLNVLRSDLADARLRSRVSAQHYVEGVDGVISAAIADMKAAADPGGNTEHQLLMGEEVLIFEDHNAMKWVQSKLDGYVGYVASDSVRPASNLPVDKTTHVVCVPMTFCYPRAELRNPPVVSLSIGSRVRVTGTEIVRGTKYALIEDGTAIIEKHLRPIQDHQTDFVEICGLLLHTPYLWGGASGFGIDCSSLIQLSMRMCGRQVLRDSDMQAATLGAEIDPGTNLENLQRGDLIFWRGHAAICKSSVDHVPHIIHASGHTMSVAIEPLHEAIERIAYLYENPIGFRRPQNP